MHHETTTLSSKDAARQWLADKLAEYQAGAEQVAESPIEKRPLVSRQWSASDMTIITDARRHEQAAKAHRKAGGRPLGAVVEDSPALVARATAMAGLGLSKYATARKLEIGTARLERMAKKHGIQFATKSPKAA